jgi:hypothetical protein
MRWGDDSRGTTYGLYGLGEDKGSSDIVDKKLVTMVMMKGRVGLYPDVGGKKFRRSSKFKLHPRPKKFISHRKTMNMKPRKKQRISTEVAPVEAESQEKGKDKTQKERKRPAVDEEESSEGEDFDEIAEEEESGISVISFCLR